MKYPRSRLQEGGQRSCDSSEQASSDDPGQPDRENAKGDLRSPRNLEGRPENPEERGEEQRIPGLFQKQVFINGIEVLGCRRCRPEITARVRPVQILGIHGLSGVLNSAKSSIGREQANEENEPLFVCF